MLITCHECGKLNEGKEIGTSWICEDCNYNPANEIVEEEENHPS